ncbi:MAG: class I SAM-dependent methyltransferase [Gemmatimonadaceae bacterium]
MDVAYWDAMADAFDEEIFNSLKEDAGGVIRRAIAGVARPRGRVMDFGCGVGRYLPLLSGLFGTVHATDWSPNCVQRATRVAARLPNVTVGLPGGYRGRTWSGWFDAVTAINVLFHPSPQRRAKVLSEIRRLLRTRARAVFVVPSLEAIAYADAVRRAHAPRVRSLYRFGVPASQRDPGILEIQGVLYKHFVGEELIHALQGAGFAPGPLQRVEYSWDTEAAEPPRRMTGARPWDWLVVARRA